jgi:hypothetical protein
MFMAGLISSRTLPLAAATSAKCGRRRLEATVMNQTRRNAIVTPDASQPVVGSAGIIALRSDQKTPLEIGFTRKRQIARYRFARDGFGQR